MEWLRFIAFTHLALHLGKRIKTDFQTLQSIYSLDFECFHWCKAITAYLNWLNSDKSRKVKCSESRIIAYPIGNNNGCYRRLNWFHIIIVINFWKENFGDIYNIKQNTIQTINHGINHFLERETLPISM